MKGLDRTTARALAEAGYLPLSVYLDMVKHEDHPGPSLVPDGPDDPHDPLVASPAFANLIRQV
jgi:hypothetical protein